MTKTAALALISAKFAAVLNGEIRGALSIEVGDAADEDGPAADYYTIA